MRSRIVVAAAFFGLSLLAVPVGASEIPEKDFARRDLIAQEGMNRGTSGIMVLTFIQMVLAGAGTIAVLASLEMSRRALRQAQVSAEIQRDTAREQLRAYLGGEKPVVECFKEGSLRLSYPMKNFGATPARNVKMWGASYWVGTLCESYPIEMPKPEDFILNRTVAPGETIGWTSNGSIDVGLFDLITNNRGTIVTAYLLIFEDIFGRTHHVGHSELRWGPGLESRKVNRDFLSAIHHLTHDAQPLPNSLRHPDRSPPEGVLAWLRRLFE